MFWFIVVTVCAAYFGEQSIYYILQHNDPVIKVAQTLSFFLPRK